MSNIDQDVAACEAKLGKEPELPSEEKNSVTYSKSITERLETGMVDADRLDNYDNYWINKLACIDEAHSMRNNLDIAEAEQTLENIAKYAESSKHESSQLEIKDTLKDCYEMFRGETLHCSENVVTFIEQVDRLIYESVRKNAQVQPPPSDKKLSFAEKFKRHYKY